MYWKQIMVSRDRMERLSLEENESSLEKKERGKNFV